MMNEIQDDEISEIKSEFIKHTNCFKKFNAQIPFIESAALWTSGSMIFNFTPAEEEMAGYTTTRPSKKIPKDKSGKYGFSATKNNISRMQIYTTNDWYGTVYFYLYEDACDTSLRFHFTREWKLDIICKAYKNKEKQYTHSLTYMVENPETQPFEIERTTKDVYYYDSNFISKIIRHTHLNDLILDLKSHKETTIFHIKNSETGDIETIFSESGNQIFPRKKR